MDHFLGLMEAAWTEYARVLVRRGDWSAALEGACALVSHMTPGKLLVGNLGDCRAILIHEDGEGQLQVRQLTREHNARCSSQLHSPAKFATLASIHLHTHTHTCTDMHLHSPARWAALAFTRTYAPLPARTCTSLRPQPAGGAHAHPRRAQGRARLRAVYP